jgi:hypothetical protein
MKNRLDSFKDAISKSCEVINYDADTDKDEIMKLNVGEKLPIYIVKNGEEEVGRLVGEKGSKDIEKFLSESGIL